MLPVPQWLQVINIIDRQRNRGIYCPQNLEGFGLYCPERSEGGTSVPEGFDGR